MIEELTYGPVEFPPGWKPPRPPPTPEEFRALLDGLIVEMGLTGPEAAAYRQRFRRWLPAPRRPAPASPKPLEPIPIEKAAELAAQVGDQLGLNVDSLKQNMGIMRGKNDD
jgi:hypothetical protein